MDIDESFSPNTCSKYDGVFMNVLSTRAPYRSLCIIALFLLAASNFPGQAAEDKPAWQHGISTWNVKGYQAPAISGQVPRLALPTMENSTHHNTLPRDPNTPDAAPTMSAQHFVKKPIVETILVSPPIEQPLTLPKKAEALQIPRTTMGSDAPQDESTTWQSHVALPISTTALIASAKNKQKVSSPIRLSSLPSDNVKNSSRLYFGAMTSEGEDANKPHPLPSPTPKSSQHADTSSTEPRAPETSANKDHPSDSSPAGTSGANASSASDHKTVTWSQSKSAPLQTEVTRWSHYPREWIKGWDSHAEFGLDGSDGNANTLAMQAGLELKRKTEVYTLGIDIHYRQASSRNQTTEQNGRFNVNFDRLLGDSLWSAFAKHGMEWDKFKPFDLRLNLNGGFGYYWLRSDTSTFATRFGAGASREMGAPIDEWIPEAVFGMEAERQLTSRQKLKGKLDYFPAWEKFGDFRLVSDVSWEILLDGSENLSLKLAATDRYDSTPQGAKPNDVYYSLLLLYKF